MKYHKISGVDKSVCTAEQKIAYNLAFRAHISGQSEFNRVNAINPGAARSGCASLANSLMRQYRNAYDYKPGKHNEDAIACALRAGLYDYLAAPFVAASYDMIGAAFPAKYKEVPQ